MPQATRTPTHRRGWRYSHDRTRNLMRTDREERGVSFGAYIGMPPVSCGGRRLRPPSSQCSLYIARTSTVRIPEPEVGLARSSGSACDDASSCTMVGLGEVGPLAGH